MERVVVTKFMLGLCGMQVCAVANATDEEILEVCNRENPSGTSGGWGAVIREIKEDDMFYTKENLPIVCGDDPKRKHFIVLC